MNNTFFYPNKDDITGIYTETARYLGYKKSNPPEENIQKLIEKAATEMHKLLNPQGVYEIFPLAVEKSTNTIKFADIKIQSRDLLNNLENCSEVALIAATIGPQIDSYIRRAQATDSVYASICQATGAMYIEEVVDALNKKIKTEADTKGHTTRPRYSPGYGDVPLTYQKDFFRLLNCNRIGLTLMDTLIMAPEKSVTAFIGIK